MAEIPRRFVADSKSALNLIRAYALARFNQEQDGHEPGFQREMSVVKNRLRENGKLIAAFSAFKFLLCRKVVNFSALAAQAFNTHRPTELCQQLSAPFVCRVERINLRECHG